MWSRVLPLVLVFTAGPAAAQEWQETKSTEGHFQVLMPGEAQYQSQDVDTEVGKIKLHVFAVATSGGAAAYLVMYEDYPAEDVKKTGAETILNNARDGALKGIRGKITKETKIRYGSHPGLEFSLSGTSNDTAVHCVWRLYLVRDRMYQLGVVGIKQPAPPEMIDKFFASFALLRP